LNSCAAAEVIVNPVARYVFKVPQKDSQAVTWIYRTMKQNGITRIAILSSNDGFGDAGRKQLETMAKPEGIEILGRRVYDKQATDLTDILTKVKSREGVQAVVNGLSCRLSLSSPRTCASSGCRCRCSKATVFGNRKYVEQAGRPPEGILFPASRLLVVNELPPPIRRRNVWRLQAGIRKRLSRGCPVPSAATPMTPHGRLCKASNAAGSPNREKGAMRSKTSRLRRHCRRVQLFGGRSHRPRLDRLSRC